MSLKMLRNGFRQRLLRRLLGWRLKHQILYDHITLSRLGNWGYLDRFPDLTAPGQQPPFTAYEYSYYSQNGEDGLILYLLSKIGVDSHFIVEVGIEDGRECNSANLILNFGWKGCLVEAATQWVDKAKQYFSEQQVADRITLLNLTATPDNLQPQLQQADVPVGVDVLSIDIDSFDYWLWKSIDQFSPRLVVIEYNASFGPERSVTVPLVPDWKPVSKYYHGASITALAKLGTDKGYVLAGCDSRGVNAFFVRADLASAAGIESLAPDRAYRPHFRRTQKLALERQVEEAFQFPLEEV